MTGVVCMDVKVGNQNNITHFHNVHLVSLQQISIVLNHLQVL